MLFLITFVRSEHVYAKAFRSGQQSQICQDFYNRLHSVEYEKAKKMQEPLLNRCSQMPKGSVPLCQIIATDWFDHILDSANLSNGCKFACNSSVKIGKQYRPSVHRPKALSAAHDCSICKLVAEIGYSFAKDEVMPEINPIRESCMMIEMFRDRCFLFTDEKTTTVTDYMVENFDFEELCNMIGAC